MIPGDAFRTTRELDAVFWTSDTFGSPLPIGTELVYVADLPFTPIACDLGESGWIIVEATVYALTRAQPRVVYIRRKDLERGAEPGQRR